MSRNTQRQSAASAAGPRSRRAWSEKMDIHLVKAGGVYGVTTDGGTYHVDVCAHECTCPDWQQREPEGGCKHLRRVNIEIRAGTVPSPDGRLPRAALLAEAPVPDGGHLDAPSPTISGPHPEFDRYDNPTGESYYRCERCGAEAMRRSDLEREGCPAGCSLHSFNG